MKNIQENLAIIGCGTLGKAILGGLVTRRFLSPERLVVTTRHVERAEQLQNQFQVRATTDNYAACRDANIILLTLKPQQIPELLQDAKMQELLTDKLIISAAAGITLRQLEQWLPKSGVIRAMPNTPCLVGEGMTVLACNARIQEAQINTAKQIFASVGHCMVLEDKHMDAVTSLNSSGPAFVYVMLESLADGGVMMGLAHDVALKIAAQVFQGAAKMVLQTGLHPAALRDQVTTPAGCTIAGLLTMEDGRIRSILARTVQEAAKVAGELGKVKVTNLPSTSSERGSE